MSVTAGTVLAPRKRDEKFSAFHLSPVHYETKSAGARSDFYFTYVVTNFYQKKNEENLVRACPTSFEILFCQVLVHDVLYLSNYFFMSRIERV